jgi:glycosyltransferase involved in cell wall biosynthesis
MKIALVVKAIYPARGGVELHVHNLAHELAKLGHQVHVFTSSGVARESRPNGYALTSGTKNFQLRAALRGGGFDVVHAHGARTTIASWALLAGKALGLRTIFTPHCFYPAQDWRGTIKRSLFDPTVGKLSLRQSDRIICLTENDRRDAVEHGARPQDIHIIPNSICLPPELEENGAADFRERYGLGKFLLSVGRLDRVKRGDFLVSALPHLPPDLQLLFIGPDAGCGEAWQRHAVKLGVGARVHFISEVSDHDLLAAYRASAAVVMASAYEGLPTVLLEAMAVGTPVIAAEAGGIRYLLQHEINGLLYSGDDLPGFCTHVRRCLEEFPEKMVRQARQQVREHYSWKVNAARVAALYHETEN